MSSLSDILHTLLDTTSMPSTSSTSTYHTPLSRTIATNFLFTENSNELNDTGIRSPDSTDTNSISDSNSLTPLTFQVHRKHSLPSSFTSPKILHHNTSFVTDLLIRRRQKHSNLVTPSPKIHHNTSFFGGLLSVFPTMPGMDMMSLAGGSIAMGAMMKGQIHNAVTAVPRALGLGKRSNEGIAAIRSSAPFDSPDWFRYAGKGKYRFPKGMQFDYLKDRGYGKAVNRNSYRMKGCETSKECRAKCHQKFGKMFKKEYVAYYQKQREKLIEKIRKAEKKFSASETSGNGEKLLKLQKQLAASKRDRLNKGRMLRSCLGEVQNREELAQQNFFLYHMGQQGAPCLSYCTVFVLISGQKAGIKFVVSRRDLLSSFLA